MPAPTGITHFDLAWHDTLQTGAPMINPPAPYRRAVPDDALAMAQLVNIAGEGLPFYLWSRMARNGQSAWDLGQERARRESGAFSYSNTIVREEDKTVVACLIGYPLEKIAAPVDYTKIPAMFVPLQQLEDMVPGTWYINVMATFPDHRGFGIGHELLTMAEAIASDLGKEGLSLIVSDANVRARKLYEHQGYTERANRMMVKEDWQNPGTNWVLLVKEL